MLKKKIGEIIQNNLKDPRIGFITITELKVSKDLRHVKVYYTVLGDEKQRKSAAIGLAHATGFIRRIIAQELTLRFVPEIAFKFDETFEYGLHINELLEKIKREEEKRNGRNKEDS